MTENAEQERRAEIWLVVWVIGGIAITSSLVTLLRSPTGPIQFTTARLFATIGEEVGLTIAFVPFLRARGWRVSDATRPWQFRDILRGVALWAVTYAMYVVTASIAPVHPMLIQAHRFTLISVLLASVVNPVFEEFFYLGYTFTALRRYSVPLAFAAAVCLRVAVHVYQGWLALVYIAPIALLFTFYFLRTNRIWPLVVAHALQDYFAFVALSTHATSQ